MKLLQWTLFIDMLGYKNINGLIDNEEKARELINFMNGNKTIFENQDSAEKRIQYALDKNFNLYEFYDIKYAFVSDSLIMTYEPKEFEKKEKNKDIYLMHSANAALIILQRLIVFIFSCYQQKNIFLRGGITNKYSYIEGSFAVGEGVGIAYEGEMAAKNPKIILCPDVVENKPLMKKIKFLSKLMYGDDNLFTFDDSHYFLDYLKFTRLSADVRTPIIKMNKLEANRAYMNGMVKHAKKIFSTHKIAIVNNRNEIQKSFDEVELLLSSTPDDKMLLKHKEILVKTISKYEWLKNYHNQECVKLSWVDEYVI